MSEKKIFPMSEFCQNASKGRLIIFSLVPAYIPTFSKCFITFIVCVLFLVAPPHERSDLFGHCGVCMVLLACLLPWLCVKLTHKMLKISSDLKNSKIGTFFAPFRTTFDFLTPDPSHSPLKIRKHQIWLDVN